MTSLQLKGTTYTLDRRLGTRPGESGGSLSDVYAAHIGSDRTRQVIVKVYAAGRADAYATEWQTLTRLNRIEAPALDSARTFEARWQVMQETLKYRHIIALLDHGIVDGQPVVVLERAPGEVEKLPMLEQEALRLAVQAVQAMELTHSEQLAWADLRPDTKGDRFHWDRTTVKILDWNSTQELDATLAKRDLFWLTAILFSLFTGELPKGNEYALPTDEQLLPPQWKQLTLGTRLLFEQALSRTEPLRHGSARLLRTAFERQLKVVTWIGKESWEKLVAQLEGNKKDAHIYADALIRIKEQNNNRFVGAQKEARQTLKDWRDAPSPKAEQIKKVLKDAQKLMPMSPSSAQNRLNKLMQDESLPEEHAELYRHIRYLNLQSEILDSWRRNRERSKKDEENLVWIIGRLCAGTSFDKTFDQELSSLSIINDDSVERLLDDIEAQKTRREVRKWLDSPNVYGGTTPDWELKQEEQLEETEEKQIMLEEAHSKAFYREPFVDAYWQIQKRLDELKLVKKAFLAINKTIQNDEYRSANQQIETLLSSNKDEERLPKLFRDRLGELGVYTQTLRDAQEQLESAKGDEQTLSLLEGYLERIGQLKHTDTSSWWSFMLPALDKTAETIIARQQQLEAEQAVRQHQQAKQREWHAIFEAANEQIEPLRVHTAYETEWSWLDWYQAEQQRLDDLDSYYNTLIDKQSELKIEDKDITSELKNLRQMIDSQRALRRMFNDKILNQVGEGNFRAAINQIQVVPQEQLDSGIASWLTALRESLEQLVRIERGSDGELETHNKELLDLYGEKIVLQLPQLQGAIKHSITSVAIRVIEQAKHKMAAADFTMVTRLVASRQHWLPEQQAEAEELIAESNNREQLAAKVAALGALQAPPAGTLKWVPEEEKQLKTIEEIVGDIWLLGNKLDDSTQAEEWQQALDQRKNAWIVVRSLCEAIELDEESVVHSIDADDADLVASTLLGYLEQYKDALNRVDQTRFPVKVHSIDGGIEIAIKEQGKLEESVKRIEKPFPALVQKAEATWPRLQELIELLEVIASATRAKESIEVEDVRNARKALRKINPAYFTEHESEALHPRIDSLDEDLARQGLRLLIEGNCYRDALEFLLSPASALSSQWVYAEETQSLSHHAAENLEEIDDVRHIREILKELTSSEFIGDLDAKLVIRGMGLLTEKGQYKEAKELASSKGVHRDYWEDENRQRIFELTLNATFEELSRDWRILRWYLPETKGKTAIQRIQVWADSQPAKKLNENALVLKQQIETAHNWYETQSSLNKGSELQAELRRVGYDVDSYTQSKALFPEDVQVYVDSVLNNTADVKSVCTQPLPQKPWPLLDEIRLYRLWKMLQEPIDSSTSATSTVVELLSTFDDDTHNVWPQLREALFEKVAQIDDQNHALIEQNDAIKTEEQAEVANGVKGTSDKLRSEQGKPDEVDSVVATTSAAPEIIEVKDKDTLESTVDNTVSRVSRSQSAASTLNEVKAHVGELEKRNKYRAIRHYLIQQKQRADWVDADYEELIELQEHIRNKQLYDQEISDSLLQLMAGSEMYEQQMLRWSERLGNKEDFDSQAQAVIKKFSQLHAIDSEIDASLQQNEIVEADRRSKQSWAIDEVITTRWLDDDVLPEITPLVTHTRSRHFRDKLLRFVEETQTRLEEAISDTAYEKLRKGDGELILFKLPQFLDPRVPDYSSSFYDELDAKAKQLHDTYYQLLRRANGTLEEILSNGWHFQPKAMAHEQLLNDAYDFHHSLRLVSWAQVQTDYDNDILLVDFAQHATKQESIFAERFNETLQAALTEDSQSFVEAVLKSIDKRKGDCGYIEFLWQKVTLKIHTLELTLDLKQNTLFALSKELLTRYLTVIKCDQAKSFDKLIGKTVATFQIQEKRLLPKWVSNIASTESEHEKQEKIKELQIDVRRVKELAGFKAPL